MENKKDDDFDDAESILGKDIQDPFTLKGQQVGAILMVKRKADVIRNSEMDGRDGDGSFVGQNMQVGDCVKIARHSGSTCSIFN